MGSYKHGKPNAEIDLEDLKRGIEKGKFIRSLLHKSYLVLLYWVGCRRTEPLEVKKEDMKVKDDSLLVNIPAFKGGERGDWIELPLSLYGADLIVTRWKKTRKKKNVWPFSTNTCYRIVKRVWPHKTPHWLRHNRVTKLRRKRDQGEVTTDDIKSFTGIKSDATIERYGMKTKEGIQKIAKILE